MSPFRLLAVLLGATVLPMTACSAPGAKVSLGYMQPSLTGQLALSPSNGAGGVSSTVDVEDSLGLKDSASTAQVRAELDAGPVRLTGSAFRYSQSGTGTLSGTFGDLTIGTQVASDLDLSNLKLAVSFDLFDFGVVRLSPGLGVDLFQVDGRVTERLTGSFEDIDELLPVPMLFLQAEAGIAPFTVVLDAGYLDIDLGDTGGTYFDFEALVSLDVASHIAVNAGYRYISMDGHGKSDGQDLVADLVLQGWFLGGEIRF